MNITEDTLNSDSARGIGDLLESTVNNISSQVYSNVPREINPEISMPRRRKMKHKIHRKKIMCHAMKVQIIYRYSICYILSTLQISIQPLHGALNLTVFRKKNCCTVCHLNRFADGVHMIGSTAQLIFFGLWTMSLQST